MLTVKIRKAQQRDSEQSYKLLESENKKSFSVNDFKRASRHRDAIYFVSEDNQKIIGFIIGFVCPTKNEDCMLAETRVIESERNKGIGSLLVDAFCKEAFRKGAKNVYAEIDKKDIDFYKKNKFRKNNEWIEMVKFKAVD